MTYTLGINDGHLATAAICRDGEIIACVSEERFTGIKNQAGIPTNSIKYCLDYAKIKPQEVESVVFGGVLLPPTTQTTKSYTGFLANIYQFAKPVLTFSRILSTKIPILWEIEDQLYSKISSFLSISVTNKRAINLLTNFDFKPNSLHFLDHHLTHAYTALFASGFVKNNKKLLIITCDGEGDSLSATVNVYASNKLKTISKTSMTNSLGNLYRATTTYLGMKPLEHEYKVMGLAAYVGDKKADELYEKIKDLVYVDKKNLRIKTRVNSQLFKLGFLEPLFKEYRFDYIGAAVQKLTEVVLVDLTEASIKKTDISSVLLSGGVFMNVKANQKIAEITGLKKLFVMPSCGDESNAIGAAYWGYFDQTTKIPKPIRNLYLGMEYSNNEIKRILAKLKHKSWKVSTHKNIEQIIAKLLSKGEIVARFAGRMEWGARALGNRSILADPQRLDVIEIINKMIKSRDFWMPFAPVIMKQYQKKYLVNPKNIEAPYMIITFDTTNLGKNDLKAAIHQYDKSARPQLIDRQTNPGYYKVLEEFSKITRRYGLLNTSFNLHGYPIVSGPKEALDVFLNSGLKYLALENTLIEKVNTGKTHK